MVHFNDLLIHGKPSQLTSAGHAEDTPQAENLRDGQQPSQGTLVDSGDVELEWLKNPVALATEVCHPSQERESSGTLSRSLRTAYLPCQSEVSQVSNEPCREQCHTPARLIRERRESVWL